MHNAFSVTDMETKYQRVLASIAASDIPPLGVESSEIGISSITDDVASELQRAGKPLSKYTAWL